VRSQHFLSTLWEDAGQSHKSWRVRDMVVAVDASRFSDAGDLAGDSRKRVSGKHSITMWCSWMRSLARERA
jgi:hypothetical protein